MKVFSPTFISLQLIPFICSLLLVYIHSTELSRAIKKASTSNDGEESIVNTFTKLYYEKSLYIITLIIIDCILVHLDLCLVKYFNIIFSQLRSSETATLISFFIAFLSLHLLITIPALYLTLSIIRIPFTDFTRVEFKEIKKPLIRILKDIICIRVKTKDVDIIEGSIIDVYKNEIIMETELNGQTYLTQIPLENIRQLYIRDIKQTKFSRSLTNDS